MEDPRSSECAPAVGRGEDRESAPNGIEVDDEG